MLVSGSRFFLRIIIDQEGLVLHVGEAFEVAPEER